MKDYLFTYVVGRIVSLFLSIDVYYIDFFYYQEARGRAEKATFLIFHDFDALLAYF